MTDLTSGQRAYLLAISRLLDEAKVKAGAVRDTIDGHSAVTAVLMTVEAECRLMGGLMTAVGLSREGPDYVGLARDVWAAETAELRLQVLRGGAA